MDWGMLDNPTAVIGQTVGPCFPTMAGAPEMKKVGCMDAALRPRLRFGTALTLVILGIDIILRYSWTLRFVEHAIFPSNDAYILCTEFLEVFRRAVWNLLRVEWEHIKQTRASKRMDVAVASSVLPDSIPTASPIRHVSGSSSRERR